MASDPRRLVVTTGSDRPHLIQCFATWPSFVLPGIVTRCQVWASQRFSCARRARPNLAPFPPVRLTTRCARSRRWKVQRFPSVSANSANCYELRAISISGHVVMSTRRIVILSIWPRSQEGCPCPRELTKLRSLPERCQVCAPCCQNHQCSVFKLQSVTYVRCCTASPKPLLPKVPSTGARVRSSGSLQH